MRLAATSGELKCDLEDDKPQRPDVPSDRAGILRVPVLFIRREVCLPSSRRARVPRGTKIRQLDMEVSTNVAGVTVQDENIARVDLSMNQLPLGLMKIR